MARERKFIRKARKREVKIIRKSDSFDDKLTKMIVGDKPR